MNPAATKATGGPPPGAVHGAPPGRVTREQIVRAGREGSAWEFIPLGLAALRVMPGDSEVRLLLAAAYARAGLRTASLEQVERVGSAPGDKGAAAVRAAAMALPDDRVRLDEWQRVLTGNLEVLRGREGIDLRGRVEAWRERAARRECFRATTGDLAWRVAGDAGGWERLDNQAEQAAMVRLPHDEGAHAGAFPPWYIVEGIDPPWMLHRVHRSTSGRYDGYAPRVLVVQRDADQFVDGLAHADLSALLADERIGVFIGDDAGERLGAFLSERAEAGVRVASVTIGLPTTRARIEPSPHAIVELASRRATSSWAEARKLVERTYAGRDVAWWRDRFASSSETEPKRALVITSRYSTFLRHSAADLAAAFEGIGWRATVVMEPDEHGIGEPLANMLAVEKHRPDLIVVPNYLRRDLGGGVPGGVPLVTWVQDAMPGLFDAAAGKSLSELDFVVGNIREEMFRRFDYPRSRALEAPMAASERKFHAGPIAPAQREKFACDVAYISHHSETPEALHQRRCEEASPLPALVGVMRALLAELPEIVDSPLDAGPLMPRLRAASVAWMTLAGLPADDRNIAALMSTYTMPIADRMLRHRTLAWAGAIAKRNGWRLHLYGRGWEKHPALAAHARGELDHGDNLRACYQAARTHLHMSLHTAIHQRVFECAMSGGLPICRLQADDLSHLEYLAGVDACRAGEAVASKPWRLLAGGHRLEAYRCDSTPMARRHASLLESLGAQRPDFVWLNSVHAGGERREAAHGEGRSIWDLWPDPGAVMFHDEASLERVLAKAIGDESWRSGQSSALRERAADRVSYAALARAMIGLVRSGIEETWGGDA